MIDLLQSHWINIRISMRERLNPLFARNRRNKLTSNYFTIISNNCWAGHVYRYFDLPYDTPTIGLYFFSEDYISFVNHLEKYIYTELKFINYTESKHKDEIVRNHQENVPIGLLDNVEIMFLHYHSQEEAREKWTRRKKRIHWDNLYFKMSEQNLCNNILISQFDNLKTNKKIIFVTEDKGIESQVIFNDYLHKKEISNDTNNFRKYVDIISWLNCEPFKLHQ